VALVVGPASLISCAAVPEAVLFGSYELLERIAEGGMAEVWRARSRGAAGFEKTVVIKRVLPALMANPGFADLLVREAKIAALLSHPNVVQIFDLGEERGAYFIAMEYVQGKDLGALVHRRQGAPGLPLATRLWIIAEVAKALDYAHRRKGEDGRPLNIVHRDISPQNVLLSFDGVVKVADFGIARADESGLGRGEDPKLLRGKYAYMSPEQARGEPLDRRSDLFSLGIVLHELLTGERLFKAGSSRETLERVRAAAAPRIDTTALGAPPELADIVARSLGRDPADRFQSAAVLHAELTRVLFEMGANVAESDLAEYMTAMFPAEDRSLPNKLRVDVLMRAYDDATSAGLPSQALGTDSSQHTHVFPSSRKLRAETRRVVLLALRERADDGLLFSSAVSSAGGLPLRPLDGLREGVFGHVSGVERAAEHAARAALELRRRVQLDNPLSLDPFPEMAIAAGDATVMEGKAVEPSQVLHERCAALLDRTGPGDVSVHPELIDELGRVFSLTGGEVPLLEGFRARADRETLAVRGRGPLVGRRAEVELLSQALARASEGEGTAFLVLGEPGAGKTRLLAELRAIGGSHELVTIRGRGDPSQTDRSYYALAELFADMCGVEDGDAREVLYAKVDRLRVLGLRPREVRLVGELFGLAYPVAPDERAGRPRGLELALAARRALRELAADRTVVLALEDLHWMDDPTRQILPMLFRGLSQSRVVLLLTARSGTPRPPVDARVLWLPPLAPAAAGRLFAMRVGARVADDDVVERVMEETAGNPLWIEALGDTLAGTPAIEISEGVVRLASGEPTPLPERHHAITSVRLASLRLEDRDIVRLAATSDRGMSLDVLAAAHGVPSDVIEAPVRRLLVQGLLEDARVDRDPVDPVRPFAGRWGGGHEGVARPDAVRVPGSLVRRCILESLAADERRRLHGRVAAVLERSGAAQSDELIGALAHHAARSVDRRRAPDYLTQAANADLARGRHGAAARRLHEAALLILELADEPAHTRALDLAIRAAEHALTASDPRLAERILADIDGPAALGGDGVVVRVATTRARAAARRHSWEEAVRGLEAVRGRFTDLPDPAVRGEALLELGLAQLEGGDPALAQTTLAQAASALAEAGADARRGRALCARAVALARAGHAEEAGEAVSLALAITARLGEGALRHHSLAAMAEVQDAAGSLREAAARWREAAEVAEQESLPHEMARMIVLAAVAFLEAGFEVDAMVLAERGVALGRSLRLPTVDLLAQAVQAALAIEAHPEPIYMPRLVRAVEGLEQANHRAEAARAVQMLARAHLGLGDRAAAARALLRAADLAASVGHVPFAARLRKRAADLGGPAGSWTPEGRLD